MKHPLSIEYRLSNLTIWEIRFFLNLLSVRQQHCIRIFK